jgi:hypothetical protein
MRVVLRHEPVDQSLGHEPAGRADGGWLLRRVRQLSNTLEHGSGTSVPVTTAVELAIGMNAHAGPRMGALRHRPVATAIDLGSRMLRMQKETD